MSRYCHIGLLTEFMTSLVLISILQFFHIDNKIVSALITFVWSTPCQMSVGVKVGAQGANTVRCVRSNVLELIVVLASVAVTRG